MRRAAKPDQNKAEIVSAIRKMGCTWLDIAPITGGEPDGLLGCCSVDRLCEIKMPGEPLRQNQKDWHAAWKGRPPIVLESVEQAVSIIEFIRGRLVRAK